VKAIAYIVCNGAAGRENAFSRMVAAKPGGNGKSRLVNGGLFTLFRTLQGNHGVTVKSVALPTCPPGVTMLIAPFIAAAGTVAVI
jgi:hypothetical protein